MGVRKITAIEMEAATIATVAHDRGLPWIVAKGVMDHADTRKDDRYKQFAASASAQVMFALLEQLATKTDTGKQRITAMVGAPKIAAVRMKAAAAVPAATAVAGDPTIEPVIDATAEPTADPTTVPSVVKPTTEIPAPNAVSAEQQNAVRSAQTYLKTAAFSRKRLIEQLSSDAGEGYSLEASTYAVDSLDINYNEQAAKSAKSYLSLSGFSRKRLIEQLESDSGEGFTHSQAVYGVDEAGL